MYNEGPGRLQIILAVVGLVVLIALALFYILYWWPNYGFF